MKINIFAVTVALATSVSAQVYCGKPDGCDAKRVPTSLFPVILVRLLLLIKTITILDMKLVVLLLLKMIVL